LGRQLSEAGIDEVPTGDFSYYDHVLDPSVMVGAVPDRHREVPVERIGGNRLAMAVRGGPHHDGGGPHMVGGGGVPGRG
ncbi:hypothetical protein ACM9HB_35790, partial [Streptomyces sp. JAC128]|uniref:hypothetical protein n=1 Tax=Streptomyces sp. JAC128 TaxID=3418412 RepID=UPI003D819EA2